MYKPFSINFLNSEMSITSISMFIYIHIYDFLLYKIKIIKYNIYYIVLKLHCSKKINYIVV